MVFRWLYLFLRTQVASILLRFLPQPNDWTHFRDIPQRLVLAVDMMRWMQSIHQMQICLPHHSAHTCSSCVCSAGLIRGKMAGGGANGSHGGSLDAISLSFLFSVSRKECKSKACGSQVLITAGLQSTILSACFNSLKLWCCFCGVRVDNQVIICQKSAVPRILTLHWDNFWSAVATIVLSNVKRSGTCMVSVVNGSS